VTTWDGRFEEGFTSNVQVSLWDQVHPTVDTAVARSGHYVAMRHTRSMGRERGIEPTTLLPEPDFESARLPVRHQGICI